MRCKICSFKYKNNMSLARHVKLSHNLSLIDYKIQYENFEVPKCVCGKVAKHKDGVRFCSTCGDDKCIKEAQRRKRLEFMKNNPEQTAWRSNNISYPEKKFIKLLKKHDMDNKYLIIREKSVFPYFIDFAFEGVKVAVEIDGGQHELQERKEKDKKKDSVLISKGWRVFRVTAKEVNAKGDEVINRLSLFLGNNSSFEKCGIKLSKSTRELEKEHRQKERESRNGMTSKEERGHIVQRKVKRPPYEQLQQEIKELGYSGVGRKYSVSDNAVRKWVKWYEKY